MTDDLEAPVALTTVPSEVEAVLVVDALADYGIRARAAGGYTSSFKTGAPSEVAILVENAQLEKATEALAEIEQKQQKRDWPEREANDADVPSKKPVRREKAPWLPGHYIVGFAVIGALVGLLLSLGERIASGYLYGDNILRPAVSPAFLFLSFPLLIRGILVGIFGGTVVGLFACRPGKKKRPEPIAAETDRQRLIWICVITLILGGIGCRSGVVMLRRYLEKPEPKTALARAARAEIQAAAGDWRLLPRVQLGIELPASAGMVVGGMLVLFRRRSGRLLLLAAFVAATAAGTIDLIYMAATSKAYAEIQVRYGEQLFHDYEHRHQKEPGKRPNEPPALRAALYLDDASHRLGEALQAFFKIAFCLTSFACLRRPDVRALFSGSAPGASRQHS